MSQHHVNTLTLSTLSSRVGLNNTMRAPYLLHTLFALGGNSPKQQHVHNGLVTKNPTTFLGNFHRCVSDLSSSSLPATKKSSVLDERKEDTSEKTPSGTLLQERFGFNNEELYKIFDRWPQLRTLKAAVMRERADWICERLSLNDTELRKMILLCPSLLSYTIEDNVEPKVNYYQARLGMNDTALTKMFKKFPILLGYSIEDNIEPKLNWLQQRLNVTDLQLEKLLTKEPNILAKSIEENLEPKIEWLQTRLSLEKTQVGKIVARHPAVLCYSKDENLEPKLNWLQSQLGLNDAQLSKIVRALPAIFGYSTPMKIKPSLKWLKQNLSLDDAGLARLIVAKPSLLSQNINTNLEPTLNFYMDCIGENEGKQLVIRIPALFTLSLERRLMPRLDQAREAGLTIDVGCLQRIGLLTDEKWQTSVAYQEQKVVKARSW